MPNHAIIAEGRVCYRVGLPSTHASGQFLDPDMAADWANGWRWEREEHVRRKPPCPCAGCVARRRTGG